MNKSSCPVCGRNFAVSEIQAHVDKCLFLNSNEQNASFSSSKSPGSSQKRLFVSSSAVAKRSKTENAPANGPESDHRPSDPNTQEKPPDDDKPLAERMRPTSLDQYVGQIKIMGEGTTLRNLLNQDSVPSMILWGPPGCGKTTLAHIIHNQCRSKGKTRFVKLSATQAGVNDVKEMVKNAQNELKLFKKKTILFMDEIHRFNKLQQDIFLPCVETGLITLIGATTENPSFSLNSALLSRCRVFVLEKLSSSEIEILLRRAVSKLDAAIENEDERDKRYIVDADALKWLSDMCDGDARIALNSFQLALNSLASRSQPVRVLLDDIKEGIKRSHLLYDRKGEEHYNIISALHKSIRASDDNAALYWLTRMLEGGEDPLFVARRLVRAASEDIGLADPAALGYAVAAMQGCQLLGMPECDVLLAQTAVYLARANKSQEVYRALGRAKDSIKNHEGPLPSVPFHLRNAPTRLMRDLGYAKGYNMKHKDESNLQYMPEGLESVSFF